MKTKAHQTKTLLFAACSFLLVASVKSNAQETTPQNKKWSFQTRIVMIGSSDHSDPKGYMVYSAFAVEPSISRKLTNIFSLELNARTESHEVDITGNPESVEDIPLGSIELLPVNLLLRATASFKGSFHPYAGAGANFTVCWEKSGSLNSQDLTPAFGYAVALGSDIDISSNILFNVNIGWNTLRTDIKDKEVKVAFLKIDPLSIGLGLGFRF
jgi:outer membrane protein